MPSGNGIAAISLLALGHLTGEPRYTEAARNTLRVAGDAIGSNPEAHCSLLRALGALLHPPAMLLMHADADVSREWVQVTEAHTPDAMYFRLDSDDPGLPAHLREVATHQGPIALLCAGDRCMAPAKDLAELQVRLQELDADRQGE